MRGAKVGFARAEPQAEYDRLQALSVKCLGTPQHDVLRRVPKIIPLGWPELS